MKKVIPISGFPEWLPAQKLLENTYIKKIEQVFESFGFTPIETSAVERDEVLSSKGEINKQIYSLFRPNVGSDSEKNTGLSLHFDLTVPLARYVAQNYNDLQFPFKRYQIQKVWRGERSQKGRFHEFYQCDIDIIGDGNLDFFADAEVANVIYLIFKEMAFGTFKIFISNKKLLLGIMQEFGVGEEETYDFFKLVDKVERSASGMQALKNLLAEKIGHQDKIVSLIDFFLNPLAPNEETLFKLKNLELKSELYNEGVRELTDVYRNMINLGCNDADIKIDITIVRGLDYYTATVFETFLQGEKVEANSICSGGRYDNLTSNFISKKLPGVGISIGLSRLFNHILENILKNNIVRQNKSTPSEVMIAMLDRKYLKQYITWATYLRNHGINTEIYIQDAPLKKQLAYANKKGIDYVILYGENEEEGCCIKLKNMQIEEEKTEIIYALTPRTNTMEMVYREIKK